MAIVRCMYYTDEDDLIFKRSDGTCTRRAHWINVWAGRLGESRHGYLCNEHARLMMPRPRSDWMIVDYYNYPLWHPDTLHRCQERALIAWLQELAQWR